MSDYCFLLVSIKCQLDFGPKQLRYSTCWHENHVYEECALNAWKCNLRGDALFRFSCKLKCVKITLEAWTKTNAPVDANIIECKKCCMICKLAE